ncbi:MAG: helix-turn-helix transcriptional regulator [Nitriliruptoraceae bacterium]|nr:helix-turn-helix transcriptional regulator [Nitriliruptoraceae bacterium]
MAEVLGVHRVTVARWESGSRNPSPELLEPYMRVLGLLDDGEPS